VARTRLILPPLLLGTSAFAEVGNTTPPVHSEDSLRPRCAPNAGPQPMLNLPRRGRLANGLRESSARAATDGRGLRCSLPRRRLTRQVIRLLERRAVDPLDQGLSDGADGAELDRVRAH